MKFYPIKTNDNTISLYNFEVNDVYHSRVGAYTEALHKYVIPSGILEFVKQNNSVRILDVCYGLGYNSHVAVNEILKINPDAQIHVTALENDSVVLAFSVLIGNDLFFKAINSQINIEQVLKTYIEEAGQSLPQIQKLIPAEYDLLSLDDLNSKLHNIYYRSFFEGNINAEFYIQDAGFAVTLLKGQYDFIFHDPFTPSKVPMLWTVEFFKSLYKLLCADGNLTTYSNAAPVRAGMIEAGFYVGQTAPVGKKTSGTIAYKNPELLKTPLSEKESGIIKTKAGIPYRDAPINEQIIFNRQNEQQNSDRMSSSKFLKSR